MADYFAVLNRTLAGFGEPKPELRGKLYQRARMTIRKQLDSHIPPLDDAALSAEMAKLEEAIKKIESGFGPPNVVLDTPEPQLAAPQPTESPPEQDKAAGSAEQGETATAKPDQKLAEEDGKQKGASASDEKKPTPSKKETDPPKAGEKNKNGGPAGKSEPKTDEATGKAPEKPVSERTLQEPSALGSATSTASKKEEAKEKPASVASEASAVAEADAADPMDKWARGFLNAQETSKPEVEQALAEIQAETPAEADPAKKTKPEERAATIAAATTAAAATPGAAKPAPDLPPFDTEPDKTLVIPPADPVSDRSASSGWLKWSVIALLAVFVAAGAYLALNRQDRAEIAALFGMDGLFGDTVTPIPVKTIRITPDPEPDPVPESTTQSEPEPDAPKSEDRLPGAGTSEQPATPAPEALATAEPETADALETADGAEPQANSEVPSESLPAAEAGATPPVAQSAILYEEGSTSSQTTSYTGRVVWSVVEEQGAEGEGNIPAIRARIEVPSRQLVLIMKIKRNADRALTASHLIQLVFAVPDDFTGGSIGEISRFVLTENEQERGNELIGVPMRMPDGIFLIALNNLESAQTINEQLLRERSWIDIQMQYRTGRHAGIALEKGVQGDAVFKEVFEAWDKLKNQQ